MKENAPLGTARDADDETLRVTASVPFRIVALQRVAYGSKVADFSIETPIGVVEADLFTPQGREPFVQARSVRDKFTGQWRRTIALDCAFAARVLDAVRAPAQPTKVRRADPSPKAREPSATLLESERRFEDAFAALRKDGGAA